VGKADDHSTSIVLRNSKKTIQTYLGRVVRGVWRKIRGKATLESLFAHPLMHGAAWREMEAAAVVSAALSRAG
jgi:hypothetical protein